MINFGVFGGVWKVPLMTDCATLSSAKHPNISTRGFVINEVSILCCCRERFDFSMYAIVSSSFLYLKVPPESLVAVALKMGLIKIRCKLRKLYVIVE